MPSHLWLRIEYLQPLSHGRGDGGEPEWPPSPLRLFQALLNAAARRWPEGPFNGNAVPMLRWLESQPPPTIYASAGTPASAKYRLYVPDNVGDKVANSISKGGNDSIANYRIEKDIRPTHLPDANALHYLFPLDDAAFKPHEETLISAARSITHLGWGVDMVAANASIITSEEAAKLPGERWRIAPGGIPLRVPAVGTLDKLREKHDAFLYRLDGGGFSPVPPLAKFDIAHYLRDSDAIERPWIAFSILKPDAEGFRPFDTARHTSVVAGMVRHAAKIAAQQAGWNEEIINSFVCGHGTAKQGQATSDDRLLILPLPSNEFRSDKSRHIGSIRRVILATPHGQRERLMQLQRLLAGGELIREQTGEVIAMLSALPRTEPNLKNYTKPAATWSTVTPVILPGHDDPSSLRKEYHERCKNLQPAQHLLQRLERRAERLLLKSIREAGLPTPKDFAFGFAGYLAGVEPAGRFDPPANLKRYPRVHVRLTFDRPVTGPLAIGAGRYRGLVCWRLMTIHVDLQAVDIHRRYRGLGLLAAHDDSPP